MTFNHANGEKVVVYRKSWWARLLAAAAMAWGSLAGGQSFNQGGQTVTQAPAGGAILVYSTGTVSVAFPSGALPVTSSYTVITATGAAKESFLPVRLVRADGSAFYDAGAAAAVTLQTVGFSSGSFSNPFYFLSTQTFPVSGTFYQATQPVSLATGAVSVSGSSVTAFISGSVPVTIASLPSGAVTNTGTFAVQAAISTGAISVSGSSVTAFVSGNVPVTGTFFQATQPVSLATGAVSVSGSTVIFGNASIAVTGTFFQATQPISVATGAMSVSGSTVIIAAQGGTLPVSLASVPSHAVTLATGAVSVSGSTVSITQTLTVALTASTLTVVGVGGQPVGVRLSTQSVDASTSGVIGSVDLGNYMNKVQVWQSSWASINGVGPVVNALIVGSSYTVPADKTLYVNLLEMEAWNVNASSAPGIVATANLIQGPGSIVLATHTFINTLVPAMPWVLNFAQPVHISSFATISYQIKASTLDTKTYSTLIQGYVK